MASQFVAVAVGVAELGLVADSVEGSRYTVAVVGGGVEILAAVPDLEGQYIAEFGQCQSP